MTCRGTELTEFLQYYRRIARTIGIAGVACYPDKSVFCDWASCPSGLPRFRKPTMGGFVMKMHRIAQSQQNVDIQQIYHHGASSRSWFTISRETGLASGCIGNRGMPLRSVAGFRSVRAWRAKSDNTLPTETPCCWANFSTADKISSSNSSVVRIASCLKWITALAFIVPPLNSTLSFQ
jgi:hypothetical protein